MKSLLTPFLFTPMVASAAISLTNGDFSTNSTIGWTTSGTVNASTGAAVMNANSGIWQDFSNSTTGTAENYDFQLDLKLSVATVATNTTRVRIRDNNNAGDIITLRLNGTGIERFSSAAWASTGLTGLAITANTPFWIRVIGTDLDLAGRSFTVGFSTDGTSYTTSSALTAFHFAGVGSDFETIAVESGAGTTMTVDNITVIPEPAAGLLGGIGVLALLRRRRA